MICDRVLDVHGSLGDVGQDRLSGTWQASVLAKQVENKLAATRDP